MGNSGLRKLLFPGDFVENSYSSIYELKVLDLSKNEVSLSQFFNKVLLVVNIASGSPRASAHLEELQKLSEEYSSDIFEVVAFPSNQFGHEPSDFQTLKEIYKLARFRVF